MRARRVRGDLLAWQPSTFKAGNRTVAVYATVTEPSGRLALDLTQGHFAIEDNGKRQDITVFAKGGKRTHLRVDHAIGSLERPLSDADLEAKFHSLADPVLGTQKSGALIARCWKLGEAKDVKTLVEGARP